MKVESPLLQESGMVVVVAVVVVGVVVVAEAVAEATPSTVVLLFPGAADKRAREQEQTSFAQLFSSSTCTKSRCCTCPLASGRCRGTSLSLIDR